MRGRFRGTVAVSALAGLALLATGCPVGPNYVRPDVEMPPEYRYELQPEEAASLANLAWWQVFGDPVLQDLIQQALENNYDLASAVAAVEQAQSLVGVARAPLFPQISYSGSASRGKSFVFGDNNPTFNNFLGSFNAAWEIDIWGRIRRATEAAQATMLATEQFRRGVMLSLVSDVAQTYFGLLELDLELAIARDTVVSFRDTVELFQFRYEGGVGNKLEVDRAIGALKETEATIPELERRIVEAENLLRVLIGSTPGPIARGAPLIDQNAPPEVPAGIPSQLLERRPDVVQAEQDLVSANAQVGVAVANFFPQIGLTALYGGQSNELENLVKSQGNIWNIAGSIAGPIFTGGQNYETYKAQVAFFEQSRAEYIQAILVALQDVSNTLTFQEKLRAIRKAREEQVVALQESVELSLLRYDQGLANYYEVLEAQQQLFPAQNQLAQVRRDQLTVIVQLYLALGGGWSLTDEEWVTRTTAEPDPNAGSMVIPVDPGASNAAFETPTSQRGQRVPPRPTTAPPPAPTASPRAAPTPVPSP
ncbi:MAG: efflux transporter outer membrane subunit [Deltaproteobacteria bacterium]|nr:efflux transporter outer membrane subunit [Deltaproteobacteria bacterium]